MFEVILTPEARKFYENANASLARKLGRCFGHLAREPRVGNNIKRLHGEFAGYSRYRVGDWRVVFRIDDARQEVYVISIAHRGEVYE